MQIAEIDMRKDKAGPSRLARSIGKTIFAVVIALGVVAKVAMGSGTAPVRLEKSDGYLSPIAGLQWDMTYEEVEAALPTDLKRLDALDVEGSFEMDSIPFRGNLAFDGYKLGELMLRSDIIAADHAGDIQDRLSAYISSSMKTQPKAFSAIDQGQHRSVLMWDVGGSRVILYRRFAGQSKANVQIVCLFRARNRLRDPQVITTAQLQGLPPNQALDTWWRGESFVVLHPAERQYATAVRFFRLSGEPVGIPPLHQRVAELRLEAESESELDIGDHRSNSERIGVYFNTSPVSGCVLDTAGPGDFTDETGHLYPADNYVALVDSCSNLAFDATGRAVNPGFRALRLSVPPYYFRKDGALVLGRRGPGNE